MKEKKCFGLLFLLFTIFGLSLSVSSNTYAYNSWYDVTSVEGRRSYMIQSYDPQDGCTGFNPVWNNDIGTLYPGSSILLQSGQCRQFGGVSLLNIDISSGSYRSYTTVYASMTLYGPDNWSQYNGATNNSTSTINMSVLGDDNNSYASQQCVNSDVGTNYLQKQCSVTLPRDVKPVRITGFRFGTVSQPAVDVFPVLITASSAPVRLGYVGWGYDTSDSPEVAKLDEVIAQQQATTNAINNLNNTQNETNDWLKDDTPPDVDSSSIGGASGWLPAGPVDSLLTLPMTFAQGIVDIFTGQHQCSPIVLPFDFINASITIPCLDSFFTLSGVNLIWNGVGTIIAAFVLYDTFKWLYKFVDDTLTLRENNSELWGGL